MKARCLKSVRTRVKADIKLFGFKTGDFKDFLVTRKKRGPEKKAAINKISELQMAKAGLPLPGPKFTAYKVKFDQLRNTRGSFV